jgi:hypothetical protein
MAIAVTGDRDDGRDGRPARLVCDGVVLPRPAVPRLPLPTSRPPRVAPNASAVDALIEDRRDGR